MALLESAQMDIGGVKSVDLGPTGQLRGQQTGHSACVCGVWWSIAEKKIVTPNRSGRLVIVRLNYSGTAPLALKSHNK